MDVQLQNKQATISFYERLYTRLDELDIGQYLFFMNLGYIENAAPYFSAIHLPRYCLDKNAKRLVLEVIGDCTINNQCILDISCGRGGTATLLKNYFHFKNYVGLDISSKAIQFCNSRVSEHNISFILGNAEKLPLRVKPFDVVINIEASHSYERIDTFYSEVYRVLRNDGMFLYADFLATDQVKNRRDSIQGAGFEILREIDITSNILLSIEELSPQRSKLYDASFIDGNIADSFSVVDSENWKKYKSGLRQYRIFKLRKRT